MCSLPPCTLCSYAPSHVRSVHQENAVFALQALITPPFELWWPVGYGSQQLYDLEVSFLPRRTDPGAAGSDAYDETCRSSVRRRVGFRRVELVRQPLPDGRPGETFFFEINSVPIFMKGA
jgi:beta-galactosidase/beta-glucuronidase